MFPSTAAGFLAPPMLIDMLLAGAAGLSVVAAASFFSGVELTFLDPILIDMLLAGVEVEAPAPPPMLKLTALAGAEVEAGGM